MKTFYETLIEAAKELNHSELVRFLINERREDVDKLFDLAAIKYTELSNSHKHGVMQGLPDSEIYKWLKSKNYQYEYDETQEYRMLFELDFPKIIREFVAEHLGSPSVGKAGEDASVSDGK